MMPEQERQIEVKRTYVQMLDPGDLKPSPPPAAEVRIEQVRYCPPSFYRYLYAEVGKPHHWIDRLPWTDSQIVVHLSREELTLWVMYSQGAPAGYFELEKHDDGSTEIAYFGLLPEFTGAGLGKYLLTRAVEEAWATGANRVWLHTCTLDHPSALPNYLRRGFSPFNEEFYFTTLSPDELGRLNPPL